jgi:hypothetical protein
MLVSLAPASQVRGLYESISFRVTDLRSFDIHYRLDASEGKHLPAAGPAAFIDLIQHGPMIQSSLIGAYNVVNNVTQGFHQSASGGLCQRALRRGDGDTKRGVVPGFPHRLCGRL